MSEYDKCYRRRFSDDGGEYLLMPRDDDFSGFPELTDVPTRVVLSTPLHAESTPVAETSTEVENMVDAFFAFIAAKGNKAL
ncbi:hypothetical protein [Comamonas endophytica]|uniref:Uncharacterized protein n=1 Tax=Comamonas endophytica TaxID=2949090 RepID=A0ABY6G7F9_9BURK|nr:MULTISPECIES: hypothetical protein [unclassified Acidovorax]MCD2511585.1 hypothetical protein [Acidovorax sp. D4N7]UYG50969.1 hypothetical protein M9799_12830 [Acidovorax sp. 5MLIR]